MTATEIRTLRKRLGISQDDLARAADVRRIALSIAESGHGALRPDQTQRILDVLQRELQEVQKLELPAVSA